MDNIEKTELIKEIIEDNFEKRLAVSLQQVRNFVDQLIISTSEDDFKKSTHIQSLINLKGFIEAGLSEYKLKALLEAKIENKKKESQNKEESKNQNEQQVQDQ